MIDTSQPIKNLMSPDPIYVYEKTIMDKVALIFEKRNIHHIPVVNEKQECIGIVSTSDFYQVQDKFSRFNLEDSNKATQEFLKSLLVKEVMTNSPVTLDLEEPVFKVIKLLLHNAYRAIIITEEGKLKGIITPYDILEEISKNELKATT